jgi:hypothetical protein
MHHAGFPLACLVVEYVLMNTRTREETAGPLGVIGSLTAGFEIVGRHLWLITLPVLLDLLLWLGPRISVAPLLQQFVALLTAQPTLNPTTTHQVVQAIQLLKQFGERFNLLSLLGVLPLLNVPSLLAWHAPEIVSPLGEPHVLLITSLLTPIAWGTVLVPIGLTLGFLYLNSLARQVRTMRPSLAGEQVPALPAPNARPEHSRRVPENSNVEGPALSMAEGAGQVIRVSSGVRKLIRILLFALGLLVAGAMLTPLWALLVGTVLAIAPPLGLMAWSLSIGLGGYVALHLLFVVPSVLVGERGLWQATWESFVLMQTQFPSAMGLILLTVVIHEGLGFVWSLPPRDSWSLLIGILGNGCIATGLTAALFVFYQERIAEGRR